jgi:hypothetical protein
MTSDRIAQLAAAILADHKATTAAEAIAAAAGQIGVDARAVRPTPALVRRHAQGLAMERMGESTYRASVRQRMEHAASVMEALELQLNATTILAGRGARWQVDADPTLHIRVYTRHSMERIAQVLLAQHFTQMESATMNTRFGPANQWRAVHLDTTYVVTRCLPEWKRLAHQDLATTRAISTRTFDQLTRELHPNG